MHFLCPIYNSADTDDTLAPRETDEIVRAHFAFDEDLRREGTMIHADALEPPDLAGATEVAARIPSARVGAIEVRPIRTLTLPE